MYTKEEPRAEFAPLPVKGSFCRRFYLAAYLGLNAEYSGLSPTRFDEEATLSDLPPQN
jgi:hypothetical protein